MTPIRSFLLGATVAAATSTAIQQVVNPTPIPRLSPDAVEFLQHVTMVDMVDPSTGIRSRTARVEGLNLQLVNGTGVTRSGNGVGNLILGYGDIPTLPPTSFDWSRGGSHNLVMGTGHGWPEWCSILAGAHNVAFDGASVLGGEGNSARGERAAIVAGRGNLTDAPDAVIVSGFGNEAFGEYSAIAAGAFNQTAAIGAAVLAGDRNRALGYYAAAVGGTGAIVPGEGAVVVGGLDNYASGWRSIVVGGHLNSGIGEASVVSAGFGRAAVSIQDWRAGSLLEDF